MKSKTSECWLSCKARFLKGNWPERAIRKHCLKSNPDAELFLPGEKAELAFLDKIGNAYQLRSLISERVWSDGTRKSLYERGMWNLLEVENLWEFEFLLKNAQPVVWLSENRKDCRFTPAFDKILKALRSSKKYVQLMGEKYPKAVENIGENVFYAALPETYFNELANILWQQHPQLALAYAKFYPANSVMFTHIFLAVLNEGGNLAPILEKVYLERPDLFRLFKEQEESKPSHLGVKAMFCDVLPKLLDRDDRSESDIQEYNSWLKILGRYAKAGKQDMWFLQTAYAKLKNRHATALLKQLENLIKFYVPNILEPINLVRGPH